MLHSDGEGRVRFRSILPVAYPVPTDGPVGRMLVASGRHPWRPAHVHFRIQAPGYQTLTTHVFRAGDPYLDSDAVFGVRSSLIGDYVAHAAGTGPQARAIAGPYYTLDFAFVLEKDARAQRPPALVLTCLRADPSGAREEAAAPPSQQAPAPSPPFRGGFFYNNAADGRPPPAGPGRAGGR